MKIASSQSRIKELLDISGDTQADMVRKTGIEKSAISNYINGRREARQDKLILIANAYKVNPSWLMGLDVDMYNDSPINNATPEEIAKALEIYEKYKKAIPQVQSAIEVLLRDSQS